MRDECPCPLLPAHQKSISFSKATRNFLVNLSFNVLSLQFDTQYGFQFIIAFIRQFVYKTCCTRDLKIAKNKHKFNKIDLLFFFKLMQYDVRFNFVFMLF